MLLNGPHENNLEELLDVEFKRMIINIFLSFSSTTGTLKFKAIERSCFLKMYIKFRDFKSLKW